MWTIQDKNQSGQKQDYKSDVTSARSYFGRAKANISKTKDTFVQPNATQTFVEKLCFQVNKIVGRVELRTTKHTGDMLSPTQRELHILRLGDMQDKEMPKVHILLKNGNNLKLSLEISVLTANLRSYLLKTTLNLCHLVELTTLKTYSHYVEVATVGSGKSFNIYENPELLK